MTVLDKACWERGCPCYDPNEGEGVAVVEKKDWVGLTEDDVAQAMYKTDAIFTGPMQFNFAKAIEAKLKEKNT